MKLLLDRFRNNQDTTFGKLYIDGIFECYTLEDEYREIKVYGETRIPAGEYEIKFRKVGGFHERYEKRFREFHIGMLELQNVPNFKYVLIHCENTDDDTNGCIIVGKKIAGWKLMNSVLAYEPMYKQVAAALLQHEKVIIEIQDNDKLV